MKGGIVVDGVRYRVVERLGYHQAGMPAAFLDTPDGERVAIKQGGTWRWWGARDRIGGGRCVCGQAQPGAKERA